jgi:prepilin-type N-terminal cleavage/methylation domain-containing protein
MKQTSGARERGFTLIEIVIAVAVLATTVAAGVGVSLASRSFAAAAAATEFDHLFDSARTIARELQGATLAFVPDAYGDGTEVRVLAGSAGRTLAATTLPPLHTRATIEELEALRTPPFAFIVHVNGALGGRPGFRVGTSSSGAEVGCPASGAFHFVIHAAGGSADRYVPCRVTLAASGPATLTAWPTAPPAASPTPCGGPCAATALPTAPSSSPTCPPNYTPTAGGCTPTPAPNPGPRYHVNASLASPTMTVGATDTVTAQATLTNPNAVPAGTPATIPVSVQSTTATVCTASPQNPQPSGSTFTLTGIAAGTCTATVQGDVSAVPGATSDTATVSVTATGSPTATPTPAPCDLVSNGKCYTRIVPETSQIFSKYVAPDTACDQTDPTNCHYIDAIQSISLESPFVVQPPIPPVDDNHELLFRINRIGGIYNGCLPYAVFATIPTTNSIPWPQGGVGAPVDAPIGFGLPSVYLNVNHILWATAATFVEPTWTAGTNLLDFFDAVAQRRIGDADVFRFSAVNVGDSAVQWYPDFPACDAVGASPFGTAQYGRVTVAVSFEIFQTGV